MEWIHIDPIPQVLTENEKRVKALYDEGKTLFQIALKLHMGMQAVRDNIFEIHKKEEINMAGKPKLTAEERAEIVERFKNGESTRDLAASYYVARATIDSIVNKAGVQRKRSGRPKKMQATGINEDFEAAVNDMIADNPSADAEPEAVIAEPTPTPKDKLPECVVTALVYRLACIEEEIQHFRAEIDKLEAEHEQLAKWKEAHT